MIQPFVALWHQVPVHQVVLQQHGVCLSLFWSVQTEHVSVSLCYDTLNRTVFFKFETVLKEALNQGLVFK